MSIASEEALTAGSCCISVVEIVDPAHLSSRTKALPGTNTDLKSAEDSTQSQSFCRGKSHLK
jgi:hypothetical protein